MASTFLTIAAPVVLASFASAAFTPTAPGPGDSYNTGLNCSISWQADTSGIWKNVTIDLMSGSNNNMSFVTNVASGLDGANASLSPYSWICPEVDPHSAIYFYQFTNNGDIQTATWTTRFTIASVTGNSVAPENPTQPSGDPIPWGIGHVVQPTSEVGSNPQIQSLQSDHHYNEENGHDTDQDQDDDTVPDTGDSDDDEQSSSSTSRTPTASNSDRTKESDSEKSEQDQKEKKSASVSGSQDNTPPSDSDKGDINSSIATALSGPTASTGSGVQGPITSDSASSSSEQKEIPGPNNTAGTTSHSDSRVSEDAILPSASTVLPPSSQMTSNSEPEPTMTPTVPPGAVVKAVQTDSELSAPTPSLPSSKKMHTSTHSVSTSASAPTSTPMAAQCQCPGASSSTSLDDRSVNGASSVRLPSTWLAALTLALTVSYLG